MRVIRIHAAACVAGALALAGCGEPAADAGTDGRLATGGAGAVSAAAGPGGSGAGADGAEGADPALAALAAEVEQLEQRAARLRDLAEIERLQRIYGYYIDQADWDNVLGLLTDDATFEYADAGVYAGRDSIRALLYALGDGRRGLPLGVLNEHSVLQPVIDIAPGGDRATARWRSMEMLGRYEEHASWREGLYQNEYRKEDGRWKISAVLWTERFHVPFKGGLTTSVDPGVDERSLPTPDRPSTFDHTSWPDVTVLPYHFPHPVSGECAGEARC